MKCLYGTRKTQNRRSAHVYKTQKSPEPDRYPSYLWGGTEQTLSLGKASQPWWPWLCRPLCWYGQMCSWSRSVHSPWKQKTVTISISQHQTVSYIIYQRIYNVASVAPTSKNPLLVLWPMHVHIWYTILGDHICDAANMDGWSWETENGNFIILFVFGTLCFILSSKDFTDKDILLLQFVISSPVLLLIYKLYIWSDKCIIGTNFHNFIKISITLHNYPFFVVLIITIPNMLSIRFQKLLTSWLKLFLSEYRCPS